jgi:hypothetical protein
MQTITGLRMFRLVAFAEIALLIFSGVLSAEQPKRGARQAAREPDSLDKTLASTYFHGLPLETAEGALKSPNSFERLLTVLDSDKHGLWENAVLLLGLSGDQRAYSKLIDFLRRDDSLAAQAQRCSKDPSCHKKYPLKPSETVSAEIYYSKSNVPTALGLWAYSVRQLGNPSAHEAVEYLKACSDVHSKFLSNEIKWQPVNYSVNDVAFMHADIGSQCLEALGLSGDSEAKIYLISLAKQLQEIHKSAEPGRLGEKLSSNGFPPELATAQFFSSYIATVDSALQMNSKVAQKGLRAYYSQ